ncbi:MAG: SHOCT domain-containing protein [Thermoplasmata archaeon]
MYNPYRPAQRRPLWPLLLVAVIVVIVAIVLLLLFLDSGGYFGSTPSGRPGGIFYYGFFPIFLVLLLVLFLVRMVFWSRMWGARQGYSRPYRGQFRDPAVMTARQRYARGEISREQYDQLMTELTRRRTGP